jgi:hypothetical protein
MNETEYSTNKLTECEQCTIYIYIYIYKCGGCPFNESEGELEGKFACKPRRTYWVESIQIRWFLR